jgi:hypothetical protein
MKQAEDTTSAPSAPAYPLTLVAYALAAGLIAASVAGAHGFLALTTAGQIQTVINSLWPPVYRPTRANRAPAVLTDNSGYYLERSERVFRIHPIRKPDTPPNGAMVNIEAWSELIAAPMMPPRTSPTTVSQTIMFCIIVAPLQGLHRFRGQALTCGDDQCSTGIVSRLSIMILG